jgi:hypothetical protein
MPALLAIIEDRRSPWITRGLMAGVAYADGVTGLSLAWRRVHHRSLRLDRTSARGFGGDDSNFESLDEPGEENGAGFREQKSAGC